jgi:DNA-binding transcriptional ArsR family regulator
MDEHPEPEPQETFRAIDADATAELVEEAVKHGNALNLFVPGVPALEIRGIHPRKRASFGTEFMTVFASGLVFAVEHLTHRELRVFALLALVQGYGEAPIPLRASDIAARTGLTPSAVSRAVARMRALGILRPGRTIDGQPVGLRISRRILFRGNAFHFCELGQDPPLSDPDEAPIIERMRCHRLFPPARGALAGKRRSASSGGKKPEGHDDERTAGSSVEQPHDVAASARASDRTRRQSRPAPPGVADIPDDGASRVSGDAFPLSAGIARPNRPSCRPRKADCSSPPAPARLCGDRAGLDSERLHAAATALRQAG